MRQTKANNNTVDFTYWPSGEVHTQVEKTSGGTSVDSHTLSWDPDGNKAEDVASKQNADNHAAYLNSTTDYTYDPVDRLAQSVKTGNGATTETYVHDANANVVSQTVQGAATTFTYDRNRLLSSASGGATAAYTYDPYGRLQSVTSAGTVIERNTYDGFDHVTQNTKLGANGTTASTSYTYDALDRTASETTGGKTTDYAYLGLTSQVLDETVAGQLNKSYQYSPWGQRLSQITHNSDGTSTDGFYGYNSHTDVETVTDDSGQTKATYGYTAYGSNDTTEFTGIDKPDAQDPTKQPYNAYRFNAKRWDATSGTYDMGFRNYDPGLNTFTTRDMYNGALADMNLTTNPLTGNRYAFGGGNPTSNVELDGHMLCAEQGVCGSAAYLDNYYQQKEDDKYVTQPGGGDFYENDTPIQAPKQSSEDDRPFNTASWLTQWWNQDQDTSLYGIMEGGVLGLRHAFGYDHAADLLDHWLGASGDAKQISPQDMLDDLPGFRDLVDAQVARAKKSGGDFDSHWKGAAVSDFMKEGDKGDKVQDWWYALNNFQYRVQSSDGGKTVTVDVFKRYNWGNIAGGRPRNNVGPGGLIPQNDLARLNTDGYAQDFNVWGTSSFATGG